MPSSEVPSQARPVPIPWGGGGGSVESSPDTVALLSISDPIWPTGKAVSVLASNPRLRTRAPASNPEKKARLEPYELQDRPDGSGARARPNPRNGLGVLSERRRYSPAPPSGDIKPTMTAPRPGVSTST